MIVEMSRRCVTEFYKLVSIAAIAFLGFGLNSFSTISSELFDNYNLDSQVLVFDSVSLEDFPRDGYGLVLNRSEIEPYKSNFGI